VSILITPSEGNSFTIDRNDKFYPGANTWMWEACFFLGKFTDSKGNNFDLGVHLAREAAKGYVGANVYGNSPGSYGSGDCHPDSRFEQNVEAHRRAALLGVQSIEY
jgi:hypothetical protein